MSSSARPTFKIPKRLSQQKENPWAEYAQLGQKYKPLDLGMGYADYVVRHKFNEIIAKTISNADNTLCQYAPTNVSEFLCTFHTKSCNSLN